MATLEVGVREEHPGTEGVEAGKQASEEDISTHNNADTTMMTLILPYCLRVHNSKMTL